ncbi:hypothetical protein JGI3_01024 [Candidatus Kryptobacter tengchongensis]|nr:hypothetical protein JGI3_01024 [Candidatus Kryptobacter tengchongensis]
MRIRKLLICSEPRNEIEKGLKRMYLKRVQEMFKRTLNMESIFNIFDEVFHGLSQASLVSENLYSFYESLLTITSYYQHSQAGRGSLVAKLLEKLGTSEKMEFEFDLIKLPQWLGQTIKLEESELTKLKFDIVNKSTDNLVFCELKMKVYSGCTAGRVELMEKFNKFTKLIIENQHFRNCIKNSGIRNVFLIGGILFDIQGEPATTQKDEEWGICYNGLIRGKNDIIKTLKDKNIQHKIDEEKLPEKAFIIEFVIDGVKVNIIAVYGNEVIKSLFVGKQKYNIEHFKKQLEEMLYDDLWLGQIITMSERAVLDQNFKKNKKLNNYVISILKNNEMLSEVKKFQSNRNNKTLEEVTERIIEKIKQYDKNLLDIRPIPAEVIFKSSGEDYDIRDYVADIIQFLSCKEVVSVLSDYIKFYE